MKQVSIIMGIYNCEDTLRESIDSIINQTYTNWELIMCDDGSIDNTYNLAKEYEAKYNNIIVIRNKKNEGLAKSLNNCLDISRGEYIARMDGDDISLNNRLEEEMKYMLENPDIDILGTSVYYFDEDGIWGKDKAKGKLDKIDIFCGRGFSHPTIIIKADVLKSVGGYRSNNLTYRAEDYDLWCRLYEKGYKGRNLEKPLLKYRVDKNAYKKRKYKYRVDEYKLKKYWFKRLRIQKKYRKYYIKPLIVGLIPSKLMMKYHKSKFKTK